MRRHLAVVLALFLSPLTAGAEPTCAADSGTNRDPWDRARAPALARFCDLVAQAEACLREDPKRAAETAELAEKELPGRWEPLVLKGRALEATGSFAAALEALEHAKGIEAAALEGPNALLALARSLVATGDDPAAREAYRALLPKVSALPDALLRTMATIDAGLAMLREGPEQVDASISVLRGAAASATPPHRALAQAALALALDRKGSRAESAALASEAQSAGGLAWFRRGRVGDRLPGSPADQKAMFGEMSEARSRDDSIAAWDAVAKGGGPWGAHAKARAEGLRRSPRPAVRGKDSR